MSRGAVTLFTVSAVLLAFSGLLSGSLIVKQDVGIVQQHLDDFVQDSNNTPLVRKRPRSVQKNGKIGANMKKAVDHFETLSQTRKGGALNEKYTVKTKDKTAIRTRNVRKARGVKKRRTTHEENVSLLQHKLLEARASIWNASHVKPASNSTIETKLMGREDQGGKVANTTATTSKKKKVEKKGAKPSFRHRKANLPSKATSINKKRDPPKKKKVTRMVSDAETKALTDLKTRLEKQHLQHTTKAVNATQAASEKTLAKEKNETFPDQKRKSVLPSKQKKKVISKNTTITRKVSSTQKKAINDLKTRPRKPHYLLQKPTHHACDGYRGVLLIQSGDLGAAAGTAFFQYVINQIIYAETYGLLPWVHFNNVSQHVYDSLVHSGVNTTLQGQGEMNISWVQVRAPNKTKLEGMLYPGSPYPSGGTLGNTNVTVSGTGVFESYFEPISDFRKGDKSCKALPIITMTYDQLRGMHLYAPWAVRTWQYIHMPPQYFVSATNQTLQQWFDPMRRKAHGIVQKYYRFQPHIIQNVDKLLPKNETCLGMHIRHSDKWGARRQIPEDEFLPYVKTFIQSGGRSIYLATDSQNVIDTVRKSWPEWVQQHIITQGDDSVIRSTYQKPVFKIGEHDRTNTEVLNDILALSRCQWMIHGLSAVSESAVYLNLNLHNKSVNLEDPNHMNTAKFGRLVREDLRAKKRKAM